MYNYVRELTHCCHILLSEKASACSPSSFSSRSFYQRSIEMGIITRTFPRPSLPLSLSLLLSLSVCFSLALALARSLGFLLFLRVLYFSHPQFLSTRLSVFIFLLALPPFPTFSSILPRRKESFFFFLLSLLLLFYINYELLSFCHATGPNDGQREDEEEEKLSLLLPSSMYAFIPIVFSSWSTIEKKEGKRRKTNSCNYDRRRKNIAYWFLWLTIQTSSVLPLDIPIEQVSAHYWWTRHSSLSHRVSWATNLDIFRTSIPHAS